MLDRLLSIQDVMEGKTNVHQQQDIVLYCLHLTRGTLLGPSPLLGRGPGVSASAGAGLSVCARTGSSGLWSPDCSEAARLSSASPASPAASLAGVPVSAASSVDAAAAAAVVCSAVSINPGVGNWGLWPCGRSVSAKNIILLPRE